MPKIAPTTDPRAAARAMRKALNRREQREIAEATRQQQKSEARHARNLESAKKAVIHLNKAIDRMEAHPSLLAAKQLKAMGSDRSLPSEVRARAASIVLRWTEHIVPKTKRKPNATRKAKPNAPVKSDR